jgi:hypothetical protein
MQILVKRAKIFHDRDPLSQEKLQLPVGGPYTVPDWIAETDTFKLGVKDGSIVLLEVK